MPAKKTTAKNPRPSDRVVMHHPKLDGSPVTTRRAFEGVWKAKGWKDGPKAAAKTEN